MSRPEDKRSQQDEQNIQFEIISIQRYLSAIEQGRVYINSTDEEAISIRPVEGHLTTDSDKYKNAKKRLEELQKQISPGL